MNDQSPQKELLFQFECQIIQDAITPLFCAHCLEEVTPAGLTKREQAVYTIYHGIKGGIPVAEAMLGLKKLFDLEDKDLATIALQVDKVIIPQMKALEQSPHQVYLNESILSCFNGFSWN